MVNYAIFTKRGRGAIIRCIQSDGNSDACKIEESKVDPMKKTRILSIILALTLIVGLIAGCGGNGTPSTTKGNETKAPDTTKGTEEATNYKYGTVHGISWTRSGLADAGNETQVKNQQDQIAEYLADTGNTVTFEKFTYDYKSVGAMFEGGQLPTTFTIAATEPTKLINNGWGRDITEQVKQVGINMDNFNPALLDIWKDADGKLYGLPTSAYALSIACNAQVFLDAGLVNDDGTPKLPTTWDEVLEYSKIIHDKTGKGGFAMTACDNMGGWFFTNVAWNFGADLVVPNADGTYTAQVNSPEAVAAMNYYKELALSGTLFGDPCVDNFEATRSHLKAGNAAMTFGHSGTVGSLSRSDKDGIPADMVYEISIPAGPTGTKINLTGGEGYWFSPSATDDQVVAALEYLMHYGTWSDEVTDDMKTDWEKGWNETLEKNGINLPDFPIYTSSVTDTKAEMIKNYQTNIDYDKQFAKFYEDVQKAGALRVEEEGDTQNLYRELTAVIQAIMTDPQNADVQALMDTCQANVQQLLDDFVK